VTYGRPSKVVRVACHLSDAVASLSVSLNAIIEHFTSFPREEQEKILLNTMKRLGGRWYAVREEERDRGKAVDAMTQAKSVDDYLEMLRSGES
jgi:hypothetical protein